MCLSSHFDIMENWKLIVKHRDIYYAKKILISFVCVEVRILLEKWNVYEGHNFQRPLLHTCILETISLCLYTPLLGKKNFQFFIIFIEINVNFFLLCAHHVMTSIILHTRRNNCQKNSLTHLVFMFQLIFFVRILRRRKAHFSHLSISLQ